MQSNNPVFRRSDAFNGSQGAAYGQQTYPGNGSAYGGYGEGDQQAYAPAPTTGERMTVDSVVQKTAISLGIVFLTAALTWMWTGDLSQVGGDRLYLALMVGSFGAFALSMVNSFKRVVSPGLVIAFAALEGVALGAFSKWIDAVIVANQAPGLGNNVVVQAVIGTFAAFAGTLAAYKILDIKVGQKFRTFVVAAMFGMVGLGLLEFALQSFTSTGTGVLGFGGAGLLFAIGGLVLGVFMLILDFDFVEQGVAAGVEERESWRAAFALTVSLVWIYTNLLRILAIFNQD